MANTYAAQHHPKKILWRYRNAGVYKTLFPTGIPADGHIALLPGQFGTNGRMNNDSQPDVFEKIGLAKQSQMVCVDQSTKKNGCSDYSVVKANRKIKGKHIHIYGPMSEVVKHCNPYIIDYDGMQTVASEVGEVLSLVNTANALTHDVALLVNCNKKVGGMMGETISGTTLNEFKEYPEFKSSLRKTATHEWSVVSSPEKATTTGLIMETFILYKTVTKKNKSKNPIMVAAGIKAAATRKRNLKRR